MKPLGPNQRRLLEAIADGSLPAPGRIGWTNKKIIDTLSSLESRGLVKKITIRHNDAVREKFIITESGMNAVRPRTILSTGSATVGGEDSDAPSSDFME